jgi:hypothetical protein
MSYRGLRKAKAKEKPKITQDSAQCKSKEQDFKSYAYAGVGGAVCRFEHRF